MLWIAAVDVTLPVVDVIVGPGILVAAVVFCNTSNDLGSRVFKLGTITSVADEVLAINARTNQANGASWFKSMISTMDEFNTLN